jgi:hypothetical protein
MPADLTNPFGESCCDDGECSLDDRSCQPCGCDKGANWVCERHQLEALAKVLANYPGQEDKLLEQD